MGALKGSLSYCRFFVRGDVPTSFHDKYLRRIRLRAFAPLAVEDEAEEHHGWCSIQHPFDLELDHAKVFFNSYVNLGLRIDRWRIPKPLFQAHFAEAEAALLAKKGKDKLSRREKDELKTFVSRRLRKQVIPAMKVVDLSWNLSSGVVRIFTQAGKIHDQAQALFKQTFDLELVPESPVTTAAFLGTSDAQDKRIESIEPELFQTILG